MSAKPMFSDADRLHLFTRQELAERLGESCSVQWLLEEYKIPTRCKGRIISGADLLRRLENPPTAATDATDAPGADLQRPPAPRTIRRSGTCANMEPIGRRKHGA